MSRDLRFNRTGFLIFPDGKVNSVIEIHVVNDETPELDEEFQVKLLTADLEGEIDENRDRISFRVRYVIISEFLCELVLMSGNS